MVENNVKKMTSPLISNLNGYVAARNKIVLNGNFSSLRIEDPKKANFENDVCARVMLENVPEITEYFNIVEKLGEGTFSKVYKAKLKRKWIGEMNDEKSEHCEEFALKYIIPIVKPIRVAKELRFLRDLGGRANIIPIRTCFHNAGHTVIVMPIIEHDKFADYLQTMTIDEIRFYMRNLLIALDRVHTNGIIHRDIKPSNFLYNRSTGQCALVDFGLSQSENELQHTLSFSKFQTKDNVSKESRIRKNLHRKDLSSTFTVDENSCNQNNLNLKRTLNEMENCSLSTNKNLNTTELINTSHKRLKMCQESSVFISPMTPSVEIVSKNASEVKESTVHQLQKNRSPLAEDRNLLNQAKYTIDSNNFKDVFETPTKTNCKLLSNAVKTPIKPALIVPETPPRTVQKNLHFSRSTPPACNLAINKENHVRVYSTPKAIPKPMFQRFSGTKKILHPELISMAGNEQARSQENKKATEISLKSCECVNTIEICHHCIIKQELNVPRAGTPGFRAPEILLRCQNQSTKIDIWSCGVIMASLLSGRYPFFRCGDDMTCLAEIITVIGSNKMRKAAQALGKTLVLSRKSVPTIGLKEICKRLKKSSRLSTATDEKIGEEIVVPDSAYELLEKLLDPNPHTRISASDALSHRFFQNEISNL
ncbi:cell division cycle 7-related protein kinase-like protein [Sarcoptes scabiei]|uniref:non-specific serine/threonine protein kinase n=1 Tax=Sarcoptes scabiei TaxID=52283 RepID=A0A132AIV2_SARSC|nr:cell division cycle 7-related protein kinase-like protein [Sarcoptes scabiei]